MKLLKSLKYFLFALLGFSSLAFGNYGPMIGLHIQNATGIGIPFLSTTVLQGPGNFFDAEPPGYVLQPGGDAYFSVNSLKLYFDQYKGMIVFGYTSGTSISGCLFVITGYGTGSTDVQATSLNGPIQPNCNYKKSGPVNENGIETYTFTIGNS